MRFWKYQGLGNDFVVLDAVADELPALSADRVRALCDRRFGVGADGVLLVERGAAAPARMTVFNADGSRPEMCGNGLRCVARFLDDVGRPADRVETDAGVLPVEVEGDLVRVRMGAARDEGELTVTVEGRALTGRRVDMGNPHFVLFGDWADDEPGRLGPVIERDPAFARGVNVSFAHLVEARHVRLRVWERGCGLTLACGTGACATAAAGWWLGRLAEGVVRVDLPGGTLELAGPPAAIRMAGPAVQVFRGELDPDR